ncbi:MAG: class I SAM-dependent methyltransferase [Candidatus Hydrogenedentes bacterium]|nr:class I SAM-dependent methyltransferase [Candidatus Hydrogenedentota bacterium]
MPVFTSTAPYYDALASKAGRIERERPLLLRLLREAPGGNVLELACGTGLHALLLAEAGATVLATDLSADMIDYARRVRPHPHITYRVGDMRRIEGGPCDWALCLGNSLSLIATEADLDTVFSGLRAALCPNALCFVQLLNYAAPSAQQPRHRIERATVDGAPVIAVKNLVPDGAHTLLNLSFFVGAGSGRTSVSETAVLRNWTADEISGVAAGQGFSVRETFGSFDGSPYDPANAPDLLILFVRKAA